MSDSEQKNQSWGGRFSEPTDAFVERFTASVGFDHRLYQQDINGSIAHATMLAKVGVLTEPELKAITEGLEAVREDIEAGRFQWSVDMEDVHMKLETVHTDRIGLARHKVSTDRVHAVLSYIQS